jgi:hypothetical protein
MDKQKVFDAFMHWGEHGHKSQNLTIHAYGMSDEEKAQYSAFIAGIKYARSELLSQSKAAIDILKSDDADIAKWSALVTDLMNAEAPVPTVATNRSMLSGKESIDWTKKHFIPTEYDNKKAQHFFGDADMAQEWLKSEFTKAIHGMLLMPDVVAATIAPIELDESPTIKTDIRAELKKYHP